MTQSGERAYASELVVWFLSCTNTFLALSADRAILGSNDVSAAHGARSTVIIANIPSTGSVRAENVTG